MSIQFPDYKTREGRASSAAMRDGKPLLVLGFSHAKWECISNGIRGYGKTPWEAYSAWKEEMDENAKWQWRL